MNYTWHVMGVVCGAIMCVCSAVACGVCFCWLLVLLLLWRVVVVVGVGAAHSHGITHMPYSPTDIVQPVEALGCAVCGCRNKTHAHQTGVAYADFGPLFALLLLLRCCFKCRALPIGHVGYLDV